MLDDKMKKTRVKKGDIITFDVENQLLIIISTSAEGYAYKKTWQWMDDDKLGVTFIKDEYEFDYLAKLIADTLGFIVKETESTVYGTAYVFE